MARPRKTVTAPGTFTPNDLHGKRSETPSYTPNHGRHALLAAHERGSMRLLVRMPTRSRPQQALDVLRKYRTMAGVPISIEVIIDDDDASMHTLEVQQQLKVLDCIVTSGPHKSKIEAVNGGKVDDWDVLLVASDDMVPIADEYAVRILDAMASYFPHLDGALYFNDNYVGAKLVTSIVMGRRLYEQFVVGA